MFEPRLECLPMSYVVPLWVTGGNGLPVATRARPSVHSYRSTGFASWSRVGLLRGNIIGRSTFLAIARMISSVNAPGLVDVPISTWGWTFLMTDERSRSSSGHPSSSRAKDIWPSVNLSPRDFTRRPGLSMHLGEKVVLVGVLSPYLAVTYQICLEASSFDFRVSVAIVSEIWSAMPVPAVPEPKITTRTSSSLT